MIPIPATLKLVIALVLVGGIAALQALAKVEPGWQWAGGVIQLLTVLEVYFTVPPSAAGRGGPGGSSGGRRDPVSAAAARLSAPTTPRLMGVFAVAVLVACAALPGCSWFSANKTQVAVDAGQVASCVIGQLFQGQTDPDQIVAACAGATVSDVAEIVDSLINFYTQPSSDAGPSAASDPVVLGHLRAAKVQAHERLGR